MTDEERKMCESLLRRLEDAIYEAKASQKTILAAFISSAGGTLDYLDPRIVTKVPLSSGGRGSFFRGVQTAFTPQLPCGTFDLVLQ